MAGAPDPRPEPAATPERRRPSLPDAGELLLALIPGALIAYFAFNAGGYFAASVALVAVELCVLIALRFGVARAPWQGVSLPLLLAGAALGGFAAWTLASQGWSDAPFRATLEYDRALLYLLALLFFGSLSFSARRTRWMLYGVASAIVVVCGVAFVSRTLPDVILHIAPVQPERLSYPLSYWNTLGLLAAIGIVLCGHLACSTRDPWPARVLGAASIPLLASVLFYTFSRGSTWVALGGVALYVVVGRPRGLISGAIATAPAAFIALTTVNPATVLIDDPLGSEALAAGNRIALTVALCVLGAGISRALLLPLDGWLDRFELPTHVRRRAMAFGTAAGLAVVLAGCTALQVPSLASDKYEEFTSDDADVARNGSSRFLSASSNGRTEHWNVAKAAYRAHPGQGVGAGMWALEWNQEREGGALAQDAHSLYYEVLSELGLPGLLALGIALLVILGAFAWRARGPDGALFAALLAAGVAWTVHAGIDWDWEMPVVTLWLFALGGAALARSPGGGAPSERPWTIGVRVAVIAGCVAVAILPAKVALSEAHYENSVEALTVQDCRTAEREAHDALGLTRARAAPYHAIAYCKGLRGDWDGAAHAMAAAVRHDGRDWELWRGLAIARASAGKDPRAQARRALSLNPNEELARDVAARFAGRARASWKRRAHTAKFAPPAIGDH